MAELYISKKFLYPKKQIWLKEMLLVRDVKYSSFKLEDWESDGSCKAVKIDTELEREIRCSILMTLSAFVTAHW